MGLENCGASNLPALVVSVESFDMQPTIAKPDNQSPRSESSAAGNEFDSERSEIHKGPSEIGDRGANGR